MDGVRRRGAVPSMIELMLLKQRHPAVPTDWRIVWFYAGAIGYGVCAAVAAFFMGYGWRAYFFPPRDLALTQAMQDGGTLILADRVKQEVGFLFRLAVHKDMVS